MIIRKPYAFLIKNFKKIHIFLLLISGYVFYRVLQVNRFVNEFIDYSIYDAYNNPISRYISSFLLILIILLVLGSAALLILLHYKGKPWKIYLVPIIDYFALILVLMMIRSFFRGYTTNIETTDLRLSRDLLWLFLAAQIPAIGIYVMRVFGLDYQKFHFNSDEEFLELSEEDREEIEISIDIDKNSFKRFFRRLSRNIRYFYLEHRKICISILVVFLVFLSNSAYKAIFITNKTYEAGDIYIANGYSILVNKAYFTDKDYRGEVISNKSNFVILDISIRNESAPRKIYLENFHLKNGDKDFITTNQTYATEFQDLGSSYQSVREMKRGEILDLIIVYKVDGSLKKDRFVLFYQEKGGILRKIKLDVEDVSKIEKAKSLSLGEYLDLNLQYNTDTICFDFVEYFQETSYMTRNCKVSGCDSFSQNVTAPEGYKIMKIDFGSDIYSSKNMIDFLNKYGKIYYKDSNDDYDSVEIENAINRQYYGKVVFLRVPDEVASSPDVYFEFTIRNKSYQYHLT